MSLQQALQDAQRRTEIATAAVLAAQTAVRNRSGLGARTAQIGLETITRLRPGFLERHVHAMLPDLALVIEPVWNEGVATGEPCEHLEANADQLTMALLAVSDAYVAAASDTVAIAVYQHLRSRAPRRIAEQMPVIAQFIETHTPPQ